VGYRQLIAIFRFWVPTVPLNVSCQRDEVSSSVLAPATAFVHDVGAYAGAVTGQGTSGRGSSGIGCWTDQRSGLEHGEGFGYADPWTGIGGYDKTIDGYAARSRQYDESTYCSICCLGAMAVIMLK